MHKPSKTAIETVKTIIITVLITAIVAFVAGVKYERTNSHLVQTQAKSIVSLSK